MSEARSEILARIHGALSAADALPLPEVSVIECAALVVDTFVVRAREAGAQVHEIPDGGDVGAVVRDVVSGLGASKVAVSLDPIAQGASDGIGGTIVPGDADREVLFGCDAGVTCVQAAIAETGSLVLRSNEERHRLASLVPDVHVALVRRDQIVSSLDDIVGPAADSPPRCITLITGPSRTADIELELVVGVHGPRELHIVLF